MSNESENKALSVQLAPIIDLFAHEIDSIVRVLPGMVFALQEYRKHTRDKLVAFEEQYCEVEETTEGKRKVKVPNDHFREWRRLIYRHSQISLARVLLPRGLVTTLVSQFDAYIGKLLRTAFLKKPELLSSSDRAISLEELMKCSSITAARDRLIDKEIETVLRSSHADQFKYMERVFDVQLTKNLACWQDFIEVTERRNLFVHADGVVSEQYLNVCGSHGIDVQTKPTLGQQLDVPQDYFLRASRTIHEIGVKLGHVLWRKLFPDERKEADDELSNLTYELLDRERFRFAKPLLDFACETLKKHSSERQRLVFVVNRAQVYKWLADDEQCQKILDSVDWSATDQDFRLCEAVLRERWEDATDLMRRIGNAGVVEKAFYRDWPVFKDWRKQPLFLSTYLEIFGEAFAAKSEPQTVTTLPAPSTPDELVIEGDCSTDPAGARP